MPSKRGLASYGASGGSGRRSGGNKGQRGLATQGTSGRATTATKTPSGKQVARGRGSQASSVGSSMPKGLSGSANAKGFKGNR
jgi:hypothetical protein